MDEDWDEEESGVTSQPSTRSAPPTYTAPCSNDSSYSNGRAEQNGFRGRGGGGGGFRGFSRGRGGRGYGRFNGDDSGRSNGDSYGDGEDSGTRGGRTFSRSYVRGSGGGGRGRASDSDFNGDSRGGGRGRRDFDSGRGRGRPSFDSSKGGIDTDGIDGAKKPPVTYVPPEPTNDEDTIFGSGISSGINFIKYDAIDVRVSGENAPEPIKSFDQCGIRNLLIDNIKKSNYKVPTPVQKYALPIVMAKRDLMACAQTGSGKTAAFLIPVINCLLEEQGELTIGSCVEPHCVIVSPTRELAIQIYEEGRKFAYNSILKFALLYGGTSVQHATRSLLNGCHVLVGTPGRINDFVSRGKLKFSSVRFFILDEADRMLDYGFLPDIEKMLKHDSMVPAGERVSLMFSATFPYEIQQLAGNYLNNYLFLAVGIIGGACTDVEQKFYEVSKFQKREKLMELLKDRENPNELTLVFVETKRIVDFLGIFMCENDFQTTTIHGDRYQNQREEALRDFKTGRRPILIATAVAARGLDIKNVAHVINFDLPKTIDEYVHRIGRTGRVGNRGRATSFYDCDQDRALAKDLVKILEQAGQEVPAFLESEAGDSRYSAMGLDSFGGTDVREDGLRSQQPNCLEDTEEW